MSSSRWVWTLIVLLPLAAFAAPSADGPALGINLFKVRPYGRELPFADLLQARGAWRSGGSSAPVSLDPEGWPLALAPGQWVETPLLTGFRGHLPKGELLATWEGSGRLEWVGATVRSDGASRARVALSPKAARHALRIVATDPAAPIRRVQLKLEASGRFHSRFLERWRGVRVVRFMDWQQTNGSRIRRWSERTLPEQAQGTDRGVAVEWLIELANQLGAEPWFCIPHGADDAYVEAFARLAKAKLAPGSRPWIEYSNEVWNGQFEQARHARAEGIRLRLAPRERVAAQRFYARRSLEIFAIWARVFGGEKRIVRVLAGQFGNEQGAREILSWNDAAKRADVYAIGAYFGGRASRRDGPALATLDDPALARVLRAEIEASRSRLQATVEIARSFGLPLVAYEGGQHLRGDPRVPGLTERLISFNRSPEMRRLYQLHLAQWREAGGGLFVHFSSTSGYGKHGSWGALEWWDQPTSPKYEVLREWAGAAKSVSARPQNRP
ncbi:MAG TPA: hypothetical protein VFT98_08745 [Myxococcota bacterium]|nr:hypothetical protein [Myxococcota bacterium]